MAKRPRAEKGHTSMPNIFYQSLHDTSLFIEIIEKFLVVRGQSEGDSSLVHKVNHFLKFTIHDVLDDNIVELLVARWTRFKNDNVKVVPVNQSSAIKAFVALNGRGPRVTQAQYLLLPH
jgi:hypothetical protein